MAIRIIKAYQTKNPCYKKGTPMKPVGILVHSTGANNPNAARYVDHPEAGVNRYGNHWNRSDAAVLVHAVIGKDKDGKIAVFETLPPHMAAWGVGKGKKGSYNYNPTGHIQFEICEDGLTDKTYFNEVYRAAVEYCAHLCRKYGLKPDTICGHCEAYQRGYGSNHADPMHWFPKHGKSMDTLRKEVAALLHYDVDGDGKITITDARLALQMAVGKVKNAGGYTMTKARKILQKAVGKLK